MQKKHTYRCILWGVSVFGVLAFIFSNSLVPASESAEESQSFLNALASLFPGLTHHLLRKLAHYLEYALLGAHLFLAPILLPVKRRVSYAIVGVFGAAVALIDEGLQRFVPGRGASLTDALIDYFGYLTALFLMLVFFLFYAKMKARKANA